MSLPVKSTLLSLALLASFPHIASAEVVGFGTSESSNLISTIQLLPIAPVNQTLGAAPLPYDLSNTVIDLDLTGILSPLVALSTGILTTSAESNVDGLAGNRFAESSSLIAGLSLDVLQLLGTALSLDLGAVNSFASVTGMPGSFTPTGTSGIAALSVDSFLLSNPIAIEVLTDLPANTVLIDNLLGITLTLNEQIVDCSFDFCSITVNAINLELENVLLGIGNVLGLSGNLIVGHSFASLTALPVPEASNYAMMLAGLGLVGFTVIRRQRARLSV